MLVGRRKLASLVALAVAPVIATWLGCDGSLKSALERLRSSGSRPVVQSSMPPVADPHRVRVATFNIQVFGERKMQDSFASEVIADIIRHFDVVAIQEIRSKDQGVLARLVERVNHPAKEGEPQRDYHYLLGPRLGRTSSKEQYAYVYDRGRIDVDSLNVYTLVDGQDLLHREPMVARFRVRTTDPSRAFSFTLINVHTDPDEVGDEINLLDDAIQVVRSDGSREDDVILLGDLNASPRQFGEIAKLPGISWVVDAEPTNTRRTKTYDNIVFFGDSTVEYTARGGVFDFEEAYGLSRQRALDISDHLPVWAEFVVYEGTSGFQWAARDQRVRR